MNHIQILLAAAVLAFFATTVSGQEPPKFFKETYPEHALEAALGARGVLSGKEAKLDAKTRELVSLGVAAQIPCIYCVYIHTKNARAAGASEAEIREAVAAAAQVRHWSTVLGFSCGDGRVLSRCGGTGKPTDPAHPSYQVRSQS